MIFLRSFKVFLKLMKGFFVPLYLGKESKNLVHLPQKAERDRKSFCVELPRLNGSLLSSAPNSGQF